MSSRACAGAETPLTLGYPLRIRQEGQGIGIDARSLARNSDYQASGFAQPRRVAIAIARSLRVLRSTVF